MSCCGGGGGDGDNDGTNEFIDVPTFARPLNLPIDILLCLPALVPELFLFVVIDNLLDGDDKFVDGNGDDDGDGDSIIRILSISSTEPFFRLQRRKIRNIIRKKPAKAAKPPITPPIIAPVLDESSF
jgi:hypothetical protein